MTWLVVLIAMAQTGGQPAGETPAPTADPAPKAADAHDIAAQIRGEGADAPAPAPVPGSGVPGVVTEDPTDAAYLIGKEIRCPVCQGMPIADSPSEMAQDMMKRVRVMHNEGKTEQEIFTYFTKSYGDWVLLRPKATGVNWLIWLLPPAALAFGIYGIRRYIRPAQESDDKQQADSSEGDDEYLRMVRDEVER